MTSPDGLASSARCAKSTTWSTPTTSLPSRGFYREYADRIGRSTASRPVSLRRTRSRRCCATRRCFIARRDEAVASRVVKAEDPTHDVFDIAVAPGGDAHAWKLASGTGSQRVGVTRSGKPGEGWTRTHHGLERRRGRRRGRPEAHGSPSRRFYRMRIGATLPAIPATAAAARRRRARRARRRGDLPDHVGGRQRVVPRPLSNFAPWSTTTGGRSGRPTRSATRRAGGCSPSTTPRRSASSTRRVPSRTTAACKASRRPSRTAAEACDPPCSSGRSCVSATAARGIQALGRRREHHRCRGFYDERVGMRPTQVLQGYSREL